MTKQIERCLSEQANARRLIKEHGPLPNLVLWLSDWIAEEILIRKEQRHNAV